MDYGINKEITSICSEKGKGMKGEEDKEVFMFNMKKLSVKMRQKYVVNSKAKFKN